MLTEFSANGKLSTAQMPDGCGTFPRRTGSSIIATGPLTYYKTSPPLSKEMAPESTSDGTRRKVSSIWVVQHPNAPRRLRHRQHQLVLVESNLFVYARLYCSWISGRACPWPI
jgi:hypothetical protein